MLAKNDERQPVSQIAYSLADLIALVSSAEGIPLSERVVRQYIDDGLLPPCARNTGMPYGEEHLLQLRLVSRLAGQYVPTREIQRFIGRLSADGLRYLVDRPLPARSPSEGDAQAYLARLTRNVPSPLLSQGLFTGAISTARPSMVSQRPRGIPEPNAQTGRLGHKLGVADSRVATGVTRSPWIRVTIDADVEINVRANGHDQKRLVDALVAAVQEVLAAEGGAEP
jgi:DNA-binding transcriptional MerR regulator